MSFVSSVLLSLTISTTANAVAKKQFHDHLRSPIYTLQRKSGNMQKHYEEKVLNWTTFKQLTDGELLVDADFEASIKDFEYDIHHQRLRTSEVKYISN